MAICASCGTNNVDGTKFCVQCGAALAPAPGAWRTPTDELNAPPASARSAPTATPTGSPYSMPNPTFQTPPPAPYGYQAGTPAAYAPVLPYAEWGDRVIAALIDGGINVVLIVVLLIITIMLASIGGAVGGDNNPLPFILGCFGTLIALLSVFGFGLYNKIYLVSKRGASIGQHFQKLKVVDEKGNIPPIGTLVIRFLAQIGLAFVPSFIPFIGALVGFGLVALDLVFPLWDEKKQTIHDKAASTYVIKSS